MPKRRWRAADAAAAIVVSVALWAAPGASQTREQNWRLCKEARPDSGVAGCTAVIEAGEETTVGLAVAFASRGTAYVRRDQYERAIQDFDQAIRLNPSDADALNNRCAALAMLDRLEAARTDCDAALRLRPDFTQARGNRGLVHLKANRLDAAIADYTSVLRVHQLHAPSLYGRGVARLRKGDQAGGAADIAAAKARNANIAEEMAKYGVR